MNSLIRFSFQNIYDSKLNLRYFLWFLGELIDSTEAALLKNIRARFSKDNIYVNIDSFFDLLLFVVTYFTIFQTFTAKVLIAVNPQKNIHELYSAQRIQLYKDKSFGLLPPHIYSIGKSN